MLKLLKQINLKKIIFILTLSLPFINANAQIIIQDTLSGKKKQINFGAKIFYKLYSDSVLNIEITPDYGTITNSYDSMLVFKDGTEISKNDISYLEIDRKGLKKWRGVAKPFLIVGMGVLSKGVLMAVFEGRESNNEQIVPIYLSIGATLTSISCWPFWLKNKAFDLSSKKYEIIIP
jgi:hypothetical protein